MVCYHQPGVAAHQQAAAITVALLRLVGCTPVRDQGVTSTVLLLLAEDIDQLYIHKESPTEETTDN